MLDKGSAHAAPVFPSLDRREMRLEEDLFFLNQSGKALGVSSHSKPCWQHSRSLKESAVKVQTFPAASSSSMLERHRLVMFLKMTRLSGFGPVEAFRHLREPYNEFFIVPQHLSLSQKPKLGSVLDAYQKFRASFNDASFRAEHMVRSPRPNGSVGFSTIPDKESELPDRKAKVDRFLQKRRARRLQQSSTMISKFPQRSALATQRRRLNGRFAKESVSKTGTSAN